MLGLLPMIRPKLPCSRSCRRRCRTSRSVSCRSTAFCEQDLQPLRIDRLAQVVVGAFLDRLDGGLDGPLRGQQDEREVGQLILQRAQQLEPAHPRHHEVADDDGGAEGGDLAHRLFAVGRFLGLEAPGLNELGEPGARGGVVFDDEDTFGDGGLGSISSVIKLSLRVVLTRQAYHSVSIT